MKLYTWHACIEENDGMTVDAVSMKDAVAQIADRCETGETFTLFRDDKPDAETMWETRGPLAKGPAKRIKMGGWK